MGLDSNILIAEADGYPLSVTSLLPIWAAWQRLERCNAATSSTAFVSSLL